MGTINYGSNNFVVLGIKPYDFNDVKEGYIQDLQDQADQDLFSERGGYIDDNFVDLYCHETISPDDISDQEIYDQISEYYSCDYDNAEYELKKLNLNNFKVSIEPGYYDGLYIDIKYDNLFFYDQEEKNDTIKEAESIKQFLINCAGMGFVSCIPFWSTTYKNYQDTLSDIESGYQNMLSVINETPIDQEDAI